MNIKNVYIVIGLLIFLTGCATTTPVTPYPTFSDSIGIYVSKETISTWTETPANDALMPESQVFVAKKSGGFSLLGGALGVAIQRSNAKSKAAGAENDLSLYFDELVESKLSTIESDPKVRVLNSEEGANFKLLPSVRFEIDKQGQALLTAQLASRYLVVGEKPRTKYYFLLVGEKHTLQGEQGWFGIDGPFASTSNLAFEILAKTFYNDIAGKLPNVTDPNLRRAKTLFEGAKKAVEVVVLDERAKYTAIAVLFRGKPLTNAITIVPNSKLTF